MSLFGGAGVLVTRNRVIIMKTGKRQPSVIFQNVPRERGW